MIDNQYDPRADRETRKKMATQRIREKVSVLELWAQEGVPDGYALLPTNLTQFRVWEDRSLKLDVRVDGSKHQVKGVYKVSAVTLDKKDHSSLKQRAIELMVSMKNRPPPKTEIARLKAEISELKAMIQRLVNENAELRNERLVLRNEVAGRYVDIKNLTERIQEAEDNLRKIKPFTLRKV